MQIIGVRIKKAGRILFYEPNEEELSKGDSVLVETSRGLECGKIVVAPRELLAEEKIETEPGMPLRKIYRKATAEDLIQLERNQAEEKYAFDICMDKIKEHDLPMKLINVEFTFDVNKIIFFFTADGRVDFRDLVRDLAAIFRTRIELRQVGVRDEAKLLGGMGGCGRPLCCASFLGDFIPVSIRMAKDQNLSLNPTKISGVCGRLMCCLKYENDLYCENCPKQTVTLKPRNGSRVIVADGEGKVVAVSFSRRNATILLDTNKTVVASWEDILPVNAEDFESVEEAAQVEEIKPIEPPPKPERPPRAERPVRTERPPRRERPRRTENFNRRYNRQENSERKSERPPRSERPRSDKSRRQSRRDSRR
ncbi:MAG: stage 0 sporulation family protein [Selenomonadaceae bacterium]|nr:stage 0 sporulation family protein [Selenomonadaceae bacterium]